MRAQDALNAAQWGPQRSTYQDPIAIIRDVWLVPVEKPKIISGTVSTDEII